MLAGLKRSLPVQTLVSKYTARRAFDCRGSVSVQVGGVNVGCDDLKRRWKQSVVASGEAELMKHSAGGDKTGYTCQVNKTEHTGDLSKVLVDGHEGLTP